MKFVSPKEAGQPYGISGKIIIQLAKTGQIHGIRFGYRSWRIDRQSLQAFVERNAQAKAA